MKNEYTIGEDASVKEALLKIDLNRMGFVLTTDDKGNIIGLATDGDIRRMLIKGIALTDSISKCANTDFYRADKSTSRENLLKQLDSNIKFIPILDESKKLIDVVTRDYLPKHLEFETYVRAKAPVRISFGGGGSDVSHFFAENQGAVINATISLYSHAAIKKTKDNSIKIYSKDLGESIEFKDFDSLLDYVGPFGLVVSVLKAVKPDFGFVLHLESDFPMGTGLGGSSALMAAILGCFNQFRSDKLNSHELAELSFQAERLYLGVSGGWQDQYATIFGGFNFMEFSHDENVIHPIRISKDVLLELEECLILCNTQTTHHSGDIHEDQKKQLQKEEIRKLVQANVDLSYKMRNYLLKGKLMDFGACLDTAWNLKKKFSDKISNSKLEQIYEEAKKHGVLGGKLLGAGGGGFFLFFVSPFKRNETLTWIAKEGLKSIPFRFEESGIQSWKVRKSNND